MVEVQIGERTIKLVRGDITDIEVESFVFDITEDAKLGSGFGGAIQQRGGVVIQKELDAIGAIPTGQAVVTGAGLLKAKHIIHANGPKFREADEEQKLRATITSALERAEETGITQLAFPPMGAGLYQVPMDLCARVMVNTIRGHLAGQTPLREILIVAPDTREFDPFQQQLAEEA